MTKAMQLLIVVLLLDTCILGTTLSNGRRSMRAQSKSAALLATREKRTRASSMLTTSIALSVGFRWCEACIRSECQCNFEEEECVECIADDQYENYRNDHMKTEPKNTNRLSQDDLKTLINGPEPGQEMPPNSDPNSLDGNLKDKRKQQIVINDLAQRIQLHQEKKDIIAAKTTASIISNRRLPEGEEEDIGKSKYVGDESSELREVQEEATIARDKVLNNQARKKDAEALKSDAEQNATETRTYDCSLPPTDMSDAAFVWCSGRHKDGRPSETDGMIIV